jgi:hypothetical protein
MNTRIPFARSTRTAESLPPIPCGWNIRSANGTAIRSKSTQLGSNDKGWLDGIGHPQSEALYVTERFHRRDFGHTSAPKTRETGPTKKAIKWAPRGTCYNPSIMSSRDDRRALPVALGRLSGLKGGAARAAKRAPNKRSQIAGKAAKARWSNQA